MPAAANTLSRRVHGANARKVQATVCSGSKLAVVHDAVGRHSERQRAGIGSDRPHTLDPVTGHTRMRRENVKLDHALLRRESAGAPRLHTESLERQPDQQNANAHPQRRASPAAAASLRSALATRSCRNSLPARTNTKAERVPIRSPPPGSCPKAHHACAPSLEPRGRSCGRCRRSRRTSGSSASVATECRIRASGPRPHEARSCGAPAHAAQLSTASRSAASNTAGRTRTPINPDPERYRRDHNTCPAVDFHAPG
jgi:hypothetical protein